MITQRVKAQGCSDTHISISNQLMQGCCHPVVLHSNYFLKKLFKHSVPHSKKKKNLLSNQIKLFFKKGSHCVKYLLLLII